MALARPDDAPLIHDFIGIGFGPSNVAMAIAVSEHNARVGGPDAISARFFEQQPSFGWHRGMLIDDATMQVSFLKDLVTLRNPASEFSFLCYLKSNGRLIDFINHKNLFPLRVEFHDYFEWAAAKVDDMVSYAHEVVGVTPVTRDGVVEYLDVTVRSGEGLARHRARNLVVGTGLRPVMPDGVERTDRVWHNSDLLRKVDALEASAPSRFIVVGAGQSAAENVAYLHRRFPEAEVCAVFSRYGYSPADDRQRLRQPDLRPGGGGRLLHGARELQAQADGLPRQHQLLRGGHRPDRRPVPADVPGEGPRHRAPALPQRLPADRRQGDIGQGPRHGAVPRHRRGDSPGPVFGEVADRCLRDEEGRVRVERDYRIATDPGLRCGIYVQGGTEHTHGITSSLLSNTAVRVGEILDSLLGRSLKSGSDEARTVVEETGSTAR